MKPHDLLVVAAHPDDEIATFGAIIPHSLALGRTVAVACLTRQADMEVAALRESELRASLRTCGLADEPVLGSFPDCGFSSPGRFESLAWVWQRWGGREAGRDFIIALYRRFRPQVVFTHDPETGEYGHPNHMAAGWACVDAWDALHAAFDPATPCKIYVRSDAPEAWRPDWFAAQPALGGRSPAEIGAEALRCHRSQSCAEAGIREHLRYRILRSRVGEDRLRNDILEHCPTVEAPCAS